MRQILAISLFALCGCQPVYTQEPSGSIFLEGSLGKCILQIDPVGESPLIQTNAKCTTLDDQGIRAVSDLCGTLFFNPITRCGPQDGLTSLDGSREIESRKNCPFHGTLFPDLWNLQ